MKNKLVKRLLLIVIIAAVATGGAVGGVQYQKNSRTAKVMSVSMMNEGYWGDEIYSSGRITNDEAQTVTLTDSDVVKEIFVVEGQEVAIGDPLVELDVTAAELELNMKMLEAENCQNQLNIEQNELKKWKNTKPVDKNAVIVQPDPEPEPVINRGPQMSGNAYRYINIKSKAYNQDTADGTPENPLRYLCTSDAYVMGESLAAFARNQKCAVFEIHEGNTVSGVVTASWTLDGRTTVIPDYESCWSVKDRTEIIMEPTVTPPAQPEVIIPEGFSKEEINAQIAECEQKIKDLDLAKRKADLEVERLKARNVDGMIYATITGTVKTIKNLDEIVYDGTPFMEVAGSEGLYVTGTISELLLDQVEPGQSVSVNSWESGISTEATIMEIKDFPSDNGYSYGGDSNPNVSYYPYTAYIEDATGLRNGEYVDLIMTLGGDEAGETIYLSKAYVRTEEGRSYVLKADENDRLVKQYIETGKTVYGQSVEIKSGLTLEDRIAFPYGKTAKEGIKVVDSEEYYY